MKIVYLVFVLASFSAFAVNPLEAIYKRYATTLDVYRVGMTADVKMLLSNVTLGCPNCPTLEVFEALEKRIILKIDGDDIYFYIQPVNGATKPMVKLQKKSGFYAEDKYNVRDIQITNHILSAFVSYGDAYIIDLRVNAGLEKDLTAPSFCQGFVRGTISLPMVDGTTIAIPSLESLTCAQDTDIPTIKKIDLKNIKFCNEISPGPYCATTDMSFLTNSL